ncbi:PQQ-dependent sugar dehydrogenase [Spirosoma endbachense]|uniref:C-type cytochrome n=1 Tax=Spirosoma endbachense TaxID=2666025 RepID=A0A6P1W4J9_9BACT|nr:PQQ-dependent sugar dehydrogenase [Spirosoma endbachense]QHW00382.1 c-type cytochrome [Spirosoma endbachense]
MPSRFICFKSLVCFFVMLASVVWGRFAIAQKTVGHQQKPGGTEKVAFSIDKGVLEKGQLLFQNNCSHCHNFLQKGIGPNLGQVTTEVPVTWLKQFIRNAPGKISQKDNRAIRLLAEYKQVMPAFPILTDTDLNALLAYLQANQKAQLPASGNKRRDVGLRNPILTSPAKSGLRLRLSEVLTAPSSATTIPRARINKMAVLPGQPGRVTPDRVFIEDLRGILYELAGKELHVFMDLSKERSDFIHSPGLGSGFGSFAFHPEIYQNGLFYTTHTEKAGTAPADFAYADSIPVRLQWVLTEWKMSDPTKAVFSGKGRELMRVNFVSAIHGLQEITFNSLARPGDPDYGLLYIGIGDGGATEDGFYFLCNDKSRIWGSVVRIDPRGSNSANGRYGIPPGNPYAQDKDPATLGELFCRGFRNPNRISWTPDGKMLIADIGQHNAEEINLGVAGGDYGWPEREGTFQMNPRGDMSVVYPLPPDDSTSGYLYPVVQYDHDEGNAISGGFVYAGTALPLLTGKYVFGDIVNGRVFFVNNNELKPRTQALVQEFEIEVDGGAAQPGLALRQLTTFQKLCGSKKTDLRFGIGQNQDLYLFTKADGRLYRVTDCYQPK